MTRRLLWLLPAVLLVVAGILLWREVRPYRVLPPPPVPPTFRVNTQDLSNPLRIVAYGDMRFTDPREKDVTNPKVRRWLVERVANENPDAILLSGDIPLQGGNAADYTVYQSETSTWRDRHLRIYPALGNHEFRGFEKECLENWWRTFPELRGWRYFSVQLGDAIYLLNLDSNSPLTPGSPQIAWLTEQLARLPATVRFVFVSLHHPPVADASKAGIESHSVRPNEAALAQFLAAAARNSRARFIVNAGHIHNYERFYQDGIVYLVSGGGGAKPVPVEREPKDQYQDGSFPNYHYVKIVITGGNLQGVMIRLTDPASDTPSWEEKDRFEVQAP